MRRLFTSFIDFRVQLTGMVAVLDLTLIIIGCLNVPAFYELTTGSNLKNMMNFFFLILQLELRRFAQKIMRWFVIHVAIIRIVVSIIGFGCNWCSFVNNPTEEAGITVMVDILGFAHDIDKQQRKDQGKAMLDMLSSIDW